jgi:hypothetical protein
MVDTSKNCVDKFSVKDGNKVVRESLIELCGTEKPDYRTFRRNKNEIFEIVETALDEIITSGWGGNDFFNQFVQYKNVNLGDKNEFVVPDNSILTVSKIARGNLDMKTQRIDTGSTFSVVVSTYGAAVGESLLRVISGRLDWSVLTNKLVEAFDNQVKDTFYSTMNASIAYLPAAFKETGSFSASNLQSVVNHVKAANGNAPVVIAGTSVALASVYGTADITWSDGMKDQLNRTGKIGFWRGIPMIEVPQVHTINTFTFKLDDTILYVLPANAKPLCFVEEGQAIIRENSDGQDSLDMSVDYKVVKEFGCSCVFNKLYGMYDIA